MVAAFNGFVGGIQAGYNWQAGVFVLGVEGDLDAAGLQGNSTSTGQFHAIFADGHTALSSDFSALLCDSSKRLVGAKSTTRKCLARTAKVGSLSAVGRIKDPTATHNLSMATKTVCREPAKCANEYGTDLRRDRKKQHIVSWVNDADEHQAAPSAREAVALEATPVDMGPVAPVELKRGVAL